MTTAIVFPGQGSQAVGMGRALAQAYPAARAVLAEVDAALGQALSRLVAEGPEAELTMTANAQPALMAVSLAVLRALEAETGFELARDAAFVAGHSLGEYSALAAAGAIALADTARLLRLRGAAMQEAVRPGEGAMAALIGTDPAIAAAIAYDAAEGEVCAVANDNGGGQVVVSGHAAAVRRAIEIARARGVKRAILLPVSAPFHCALMRPAALVMERALAEARVVAPAIPVVANVSARPVTDPDAIRASLVAQVAGPVRWRESVAWLAAMGVTRFVELGAGKVLSGLIRRIAPDVEVFSIGEPADVAAFAAAHALSRSRG